jgi:hypothetical protein
LNSCAPITNLSQMRISIPDRSSNWSPNRVKKVI